MMESNKENMVGVEGDAKFNPADVNSMTVTVQKKKLRS